jgi:hypothetical protein
MYKEKERAREIVHIYLVVDSAIELRDAEVRGIVCVYSFM